MRFKLEIKDLTDLMTIGPVEFLLILKTNRFFTIYEIVKQYIFNKKITIILSLI
jgi:hypothetical protein